MWQEFLINKYLQGEMLFLVLAKPTESPFWKGLMGVKHEFRLPTPFWGGTEERGVPCDALLPSLSLITCVCGTKMIEGVSID